MCDIAPLDPAGVGQDQRRAVGGVTGPSVPHTSHVLGGQRKSLLFWAYLWLFGGSDGVPLSRSCVIFPPLDQAKVGKDQSRVEVGDTGPQVFCTSHLFDG